MKKTTVSFTTGAILEYFKIKSIWISLFTIFLFLGSELVFSQVDTRTIVGRVYRYRYSGYTANNIKVSLIGPGNQYRSVTTGTITGQGDGWYAFLLLTDGTYTLRFHNNTTFGSFYNAPNPSSDQIPMQHGTSVDSTEAITIVVDGSDVHRPTIYARGRLYNISGRVDSTGAFASNIGIANVWVRATCSYAVAGGVPPRDTVWALTDANGNYTLENVNSEGHWYYRPRNGQPGTNNYTINGFSTPGELNNNTLTGNLVNRNFNFSIQRYNIGGTITFNQPGGGTVNLSNIAVNLEGPVNKKETISNVDGTYQFTNNPTNYFYTAYTITPISNEYDFTPTSRQIQPLTGNSNNNNFVARLKMKTISGVCIDGVDPKPGVMVYFDSLQADASYKTIDSVLSGLDGSYSRQRAATGTYKVYAKDTATVSPLVFYPLSAIFENLREDKVQNFSTAKDRHWISGTVTNITTLPAVPAEGIILDVTGGAGYSSSVVTLNDGTYSILVPDNDIYTVTARQTKGAIFNPLKVENLSGNLDISNVNFTVEFIVPELVSPAVNTIIQSKLVNFLWKSIPGASDYTLEYSTTPNFSENVVELHPAPLTDTTIQLNLPAFNTMYYWRVKAKKGSVESDWSDVWNFRTGLDKPVLLTPANHTDVIASSVTLRWNAVPGADQYEILATDSATGSTVLNQMLTSTSVTLTTLTDKKSYSWRVRAINTGSTSEWSDLWNFYLLKEQYKITGTIKKSTGGTVPNVVLSLNGGASVTTSNSSGNYEFTVNTNSTNIITPVMDGYKFRVEAPALDSIINTIRADSILNFIATPISSAISGTVFDYDGITPLSGVTVSCNNGTHSRNIITDASGNYSFNVSADSNYSITPDRTGYVFNPGNRTYVKPNTTYTNQNFKAELNAFTIIGYVKRVTTNAPVKNVMITVSGSSNFSTLTDDNGKYTFTALLGGTYSIGALKKGYTVVSANGNPQQLLSASKDSVLIDFIATPNPYTISGYVFNFDGVSKLSGVTVSAPGAAPASITTDTSGYFSFTVDIEHSYTITPARTGYVFTPADKHYDNPDTNYINQNFYAVQNGSIVDGYVKNGATGVSEVLIEYAVDSLFTNPDYVYTNTAGYYKFSALNGSNYWVRAAKAGYTITSINGNPQSSGVIAANKTLPDFIATPNKYTISGKALFGGIGLAGVSLACPGADTTPVISGADGSYHFTVTALQNYTVTPQKMGFSFNPPSITIPNISANSPNNNFVATVNEVPELVSPINGSIGVSVNPLLTWKGVTGATSYNLQYSTEYDFSSFVQIPNIAGLTKQITNLNSQTTYYWRVNANVPGGSSGWSAVWSFRTAGGKIAWAPSSLVYDPTIIGRTRTKSVIVTNQGADLLRLSNITLAGPDKTNFFIVNDTPVPLNPGQSYEIKVDFIPKTTGVLNATLVLDHNDISTDQNPIEIPLIGTGVSTMVTLDLPNVLDFGNVIYGSGWIEKTITVYNNSTIPGDYLTISSHFFDVSTDIFKVVTPFPIVLEPGTTYPLTVRFNPDKLGLQTNNLHVLNTSSNSPDAKILVRGNVIQGDLLVFPSPIDFGNTTKQNPYKDTLVNIQNNSSNSISITKLELTGDLFSFAIFDDKPFVLGPNQTKQVAVRFFPRTAGKKSAFLNVISDYVFAPKIIVPLTGVGGDDPLATITSRLVDFGIMKKGQIKDTSIFIKNEGSLDLVISAQNITGKNTDIFSTVNMNLPVVLRSGESYELRLRATALLPVGAKSAHLTLTSNDPSNPKIEIDMIAQVRSLVLIKSVDKIEFDTVDVGYYQDSLVIIKNEGDIKATITNISFDGPFENDFSMVETPTKFDLMPGEIKIIKLRFAPLDVGLRYARIVFKLNDEAESEQFIILKGWGRKPVPAIGVGGFTEDNTVDFLVVPIFETRTKTIQITNLSKFNRLMIDSMFFEFIEKQPFSYSGIKPPEGIAPGKSVTITLSFNPHDKVNSYTGLLNIVYRDSTQSSGLRQTVKVKVRGQVIFPGANVKLTPVLKFGKVIKGQSKVAMFDITNLGVSYLKIDSIKITGADFAEFNPVEKDYPISIITNQVLSRTVSFNPQKVGSKDAFVTIYWNDLFVDGNVEIWAECILSGDVTAVKTEEIPTEFALRQNYPNPFNPTTKIEFSIPQGSNVVLKLYNSNGQEIRTLAAGYYSPGVYRIDLNAADLATGMYFYRLSTDKFNSVKKLLLIK